LAYCSEVLGMSGCGLPAGAASPGEETGDGLAIRLFGPMEVRLGSQPLPRLHSRKGLWLLALLALRGGRDVEREWLSGVLWPDSDARHSRRSLRQSVHDLRVALGPEGSRLAAQGSRTLRLDLSGAFVDALAFDAAVARGDPDSLAAAVRLYRGPLLEDCTEEWSLQERGPREQAYVGALAALAAAATARGEPAVAADYLRLAVGVDPYREELQRALMQSLSESGNPASALMVYQRLSDLLRRELAAEPAAETTTLFRQLRDATRARARPDGRRAAGGGGRMEAGRDGPGHAGRPLPLAALPRRLPSPLTQLIGREEEGRAVVARLGEARLVTLTGVGGIGKSRLAVQVATELAEQFPDGTSFVELAGLADGALVAATVAASLGLPEPAGRPALEALGAALWDRELLLVLDNCEHLLPACAEVAASLLGRCAGVRVLATSRQPLGLAGEVIWRVPSLEVPGSSALPAGVKDAASYFLGYDAVRLFVARAHQADPHFRLAPGDAALVAQLCRRLDGIPLAIELAAARVRAMTVGQIAARLDDRFRLLTGGSRAALPRQQTLRGTLDWSDDLLSEPERALIRRLSVFAGGWTLEAAEAVCGDRGVRRAGCGLPGADRPIRKPQSTIHDHEVLDLLTGLVDRSLVVYDERDGAPPDSARYRLLETVRQYFNECLQEGGEEETIRGQHLEYFLALAEEAEPHLTGARQSEWLERLETEHDNLRTALEHSTDAPALGLRLAVALWRFWRVRGYLREGRERLARALSAAAGAGTSESVKAVRLTALNAAGSLAANQGDYRTARSLHEEGLALARESGDRPGIAHSLNYLGTVAEAQGDYAAARSLYEQSLAIRRELEDRLAIADSLDDLGTVAEAQEDFGTARSLYEQSLAIKQEFGDRLGIAQSLNYLGMVARQQGDYAAARSLHARSLAIRRELGLRSPVAYSLNHLGMVAHQQGDYGAARSYFEESLSIRRELGDRPATAASLNQLGMVAREQGDYAAARSFFEESLSIRHETGNRRGIGESLEALGALACEEPGRSDGRDGAGDGAPVPKAGSAHPAEAAWRAARLLGAAQALRETIGVPLRSREHAVYGRAVSRARELLGEEAFAAAWLEGQTMTLEQAIADARRETGATSPSGQEKRYDRA
jgi:predicted ATPase/DNA-binding SARP family transcriptional activator/uncharacterized protein HemY